ncbi:radical SAM protein [Caldalkalibacillus thermarum]|uniref:SPL family radical SAM protein n=1 Tax=Caldalkalibacillus thermarum TaxID=296745 RepID=UPI00166369DF|nr:radical SAM protein [Caldalkalibacillus thermarum]GGK14762.1 radical SAM protein [Caldalkalibacillus thermarum]
MTPVCEPLTAKQVLNRVKAPAMPFDWSLNPYRGCQHGCSFCYARATHRFLDLECDDTFQHYILYKQNAVEALTEQLKRMAGFSRTLKHIGTVAIGTATDPYQPLEGKLQLTRKCLEVLARYQVPVSITTRSPLILRDIDVLKTLPVVSINFSVNTMQKHIWRMLEPASPHPRQRLAAVRRLSQEGLPAGIFLAPIVPYLTDRPRDLREVIASAAEHGARFVMPSYLRLSTPEVKTWFLQVLKQREPSLVQRYEALYRYGRLPDRYRERIDRHINQLLEHYGFSRERASEDTSREVLDQEPQQLSFSF